MSKDIMKQINPMSSKLRQIALAVAAGVLLTTPANAAPPVTSGLTLHLDASQLTGLSDGATVTIWTDMSGLGNHATTSAGTPIYKTGILNGQPVVRFNGSSKMTLADLSASFPVAASIFAVITPNNDNMYSAFGNRNNDERWMGGNWSEVTPGAFRGSRANFSSSYSLMPRTGTHIFAYESSSAAYKFLLNGNLIGTASADYNSASGQTWGIGYNGINNGAELDGDIAELILYNRVLTTSEASQVGMYLSGKYGLVTEYRAPAKILAFGPGATIGSLSGNKADISWTVPLGSDLAALSPTFTLSDGATGTVDSVTAVSGETRSFTNLVHYIVTSSDTLTTNDYSVRVILSGVIPGGDFQLYKPGSTNVTASITTGWGVAWPNASPTNLLVQGAGGLLTYSDSTTGTMADLLQWTKTRGGANILPNGPGGSHALNAFATWGGHTQVETLGSLHTVASDQTVTISVMVGGGVTGPMGSDLTFSLYANGVPLVPSSSVHVNTNNTAPFQMISRTYAAAALAGHIGAATKIVLGAELTNPRGGAIIYDDVTLAISVAALPTTTALVSSGNPTTYGQNVTFTATVSPTPTGGTVQFYNGGSPLGSPVTVNTGTGQAAYTTNSLVAGTREITATYSGYGGYLASTASAVSQVVNKAPLTVRALNAVRAPNTANPNPFSYQIVAGVQNGETLATTGVTGSPVLTTAAVPSSPVGNYTITCTLGSLAASNYSFTLVNGTLTVKELINTFSVNFFVGPDWPYGGLSTDVQKANVRLDAGNPAGFGDWYTSGWTNFLVPWGLSSPMAPVTLTSTKGNTATLIFKDCRNGYTYSGGPRTTLLGDGNGNMMDAHVNSTLDGASNKFDMEVTNITFAAYDVIFYLGATAAQYQDGTGIIKFNGGAERAFKLKQGAFDGTFTEMVDATTQGNYIVFKKVTGSSFTAQTWGTGPNGFNHIGPFGFQIRDATPKGSLISFR